MRTSFRRYGLAAILGVAGAMLLLAGTAASLGYVDLPSARRETPAPATDERAIADGLELDARIALDTPLAPLDPVNVHAEPEVLRALPLPGASVDREAALDEAGLGIDADLALATGSHRAKTQGGAETVSTASMRALLAPASAPIAFAAAAFTLAGAIAYFWTGAKTWALRLGVFPLLGLYAKITRAEVFDNDVRERIFQTIRAHPGVSASDLARVAGVSWGTTIYHLEVLEQTRMVTSLRKGRYRRYFENGATLASSKEIVAVLQNPVTASVVEALRRAPGVSQKDLALATSMTPQALHWHVTRLVGAGVVRKERAGRVVRHFVRAG